MLTITVGQEEYFDDDKQEFIKVGGFQLQLEHSLVSLSKWESKFEKPFLIAGEKRNEEVLSYIECMIISPEFPPEVLSLLSQANVNSIQEYIDAKMTATWFYTPPNEAKRPSKEVVTSELVYYWLIACNIPFECETWHLNRLLTLIKICEIKNGKPKKKSRAESAAEQRHLNEQRMKDHQTTG